MKTNFKEYAAKGSKTVVWHPFDNLRPGLKFRLQQNNLIIFKLQDNHSSDIYYRCGFYECKDRNGPFEIIPWHQLKYEDSGYLVALNTYIPPKVNYYENNIIPVNSKIQQSILEQGCTGKNLLKYNYEGEVINKNHLVSWCYYEKYMIDGVGLSKEDNFFNEEDIREFGERRIDWDVHR